MRRSASTCRTISARCPGCWRAIATTTPRTSRSPYAASAPTPPSASAACASTRTASRPRAPTARGRCRSSTWTRPRGSRFCAGRSPRCTATPAGGVIQLFTADGRSPDQLRAAAAYGSFGVWRAGLDASGAAGPLAYNADYTHFSVDGYRPHSSADNDSFNAKLGYDADDRSHLALVLNVISRPDAQDPLGLTPAQFSDDPYQADPAALSFNTRKSLQQQQGGLTWNLDLTHGQTLQVMGYYGHRSVLQFLSIPMGAQNPPTSSGRRRRSRPPIRRRRRPLGLAERAGRSSVHLGRGEQLRPPERAASRLQQLRRRDPRGAGGVAPRRERHHLRHRRVHAGHVGHHPALVAHGRRATQRRELPGPGPVHHGQQRR